MVEVTRSGVDLKVRILLVTVFCLLILTLMPAVAHAASAVDITKANVESGTYDSYIAKDMTNMDMTVTFSSEIPATADMFDSKMTWKFVNDWSGLSGGTTPYDPAYNSVSLKGSNGLFSWKFLKLSASAAGPYFGNVRIYTPSELEGFAGYTELPAGNENSVYVTTEMTQDLSDETTATGDPFATLTVKVTGGASRIAAGDTVSVTCYHNGATGTMSSWSDEAAPQANVLLADAESTTIDDSAVVDSNGCVTFAVPTGGNYVITWVSAPETWVSNIDSTAYYKADFAQYVNGIGTNAMDVTFNSDISPKGVCFNTKMTWPFVNNFSGFDSVGGGTTIFPAFSPACTMTLISSDGSFIWKYNPLNTAIAKGSAGQGPYQSNVRIYSAADLESFAGYTGLPAGDAFSTFVTTESTRDFRNCGATKTGAPFVTLKVKVSDASGFITAGDTVDVVRYYNGATGSMSGWSDETTPQANVLLGNASDALTVADDVTVDSDGYVTFTVPTGGNYVIEPTSHSITTIAGSNRFETSSMTTLAALGDDSCGGVIIACAMGSGPTGTFADALAGSGLSGITGYPILLTDSSALQDTTKEALDALVRANGSDPLDIIVLGGTNSVSEAVEGELVGYGTVNRIAGANRYETAQKIYEYGATLGSGWTGTPIITTGTNYPDALAISSYAASQDAPVFLVTGDELPAYVATALQGKTSAVILGSSLSVSTSIETAVGNIVGAGNVVRLGGKNRYATSLLIVKWELENGLSASTLGIATGANFPDALGSSFYMAKVNGPLCLVSPDDTENAALYEFLTSQKDKVGGAVAYGGENAVSSTTKADIADALGWN